MQDVCFLEMIQTESFLNPTYCRLSFSKMEKSFIFGQFRRFFDFFVVVHVEVVAIWHSICN